MSKHCPHSKVAKTVPFLAGVCDLGHTAGKTGSVSHGLILQGGHNITLKEKRHHHECATVKINARDQSIQTQNLFDLTLSGNTSGTLALVSSGTLTLAGGNNIILSQAGNAITISAAAIGAGSFLAGISTGGNTSGTSGTIANELIFAGGNNITLSQSTNGQSATITISAFDQSIQTQNIIRDVNIGGNTYGTTADITSGTLVLVGGYNITLSQIVNTITISGGEQITAVVSNLGNTAGLTGAPAVMDKLIFVGGNNITLSQTFVGEDVTITFNAQSQSVQTQSIIRDVNITGHTSGTTADITSGTLFLAGGNNITLSQQSNTITISAFNQSQQTQNIIRDVNIGGNTSGTTANITSGTLSLIGGYAITLSQNANTITISGGEQITAVVSDLGNTAGLTGAPVRMDQLIFVGGDNITLSQTFIGEDVTITFNAQSQSTQTQNIINDVNIIGNTSGTTANITSGTLFLAGGNNITLSQVNNSITISAHTVSQFSGGISNIGNTSGTSGTVVNQIIFAGGNNITLSQSINGQSATITISGITTLPAYSAGISTIGNTVGTTGLASQRLVLAGGNNITLSGSTNAGSMTVTISAPSQTTQTQNLFDLTLSGNTSGALQLISSGTLTLAGGNNITMSQAGNAITISAFNQTTQTQNLFDLTLSGNTSGALQLISNGTLTLAGGNNITLSQAGNAITISAAAVGAGSFSAGVSDSGNTAGTTGTVANQLVFVGTNNVTLSQSKDGQSATITISVAAIGAGSFSAGISTLGNTSGDTGTVANRLVFAGGNNITLSQSTIGQSATITISAFNQSIQTQNIIRDVNISGNTTGITADITSGTLIIAGGNNITISQAGGNAITISGGNSYSAGMSNLGNTSGVSGLASQQLVLVGGNNITLSQSTNAGSVTITISAFSETISLFSAGASNLGNLVGTTGTFDNQFILVGGGNITLSQSIDVANHFGTITISGASDTATQFSGGVSNLGNSVGTTGTVDNQIVFVGGNNITLSQSTNGQSATITISAFAQTLQTQNLFDLTLSGNTSGTLALISSGTLTLAGGNNITLSQSNNKITISAQNQSVQTQNLIDVTLSGNTSGTLALISSGTMTLAGGNNITLNQAGNAVTISGGDKFIAGVSNLGNTSGTTGTIDDQLVFVGGNNITLIQSADVLSESGTITISAANQTTQTQNLFDLTLSGNTSGTLSLISSGTLTLAGGNNITLSQSGNVITISAFNQTVQTQNLIDITISGNTTGTLALISSGTMTLAGGNNITLSQVGNGVTVSGANQTFRGQMSNLGNTAGTSTGTVSSQLILVGGSNITLSQSVNAGSATLTINAQSQSVQTQNLFDITLSGNTSGTLTLVSSGTLTLAGGNNITLSQSGNAITISAFTQTVQTQNLIDVTLSGNTSGALALISSGTMTLAGGNNITLSQAGNAVTISAASQSLQTQSIIRDVNIIGNTSGTTADITSGTLFLAGGNNITLSQNGNSITISAPSEPTLSYWANADQTISTIATSDGRFWLAPLDPTHDLFPGNMTVSTALLNFSVTDADISNAFTMSWKIGIYTMNGVSLSLLNSVATSFGNAAAAAANSSLFSGERFLTIHSSAWSIQPTFSNTKYFIGMIGNSNTDEAAATVNFSIEGFRILGSGTIRSGTIGVGLTSGNTSRGVMPWIGVSGSTRNITSGLPTNIQLSQLVKTGAFYGFIPHIQFNNISSNF